MATSRPTPILAQPPSYRPPPPPACPTINYGNRDRFSPSLPDEHVPSPVVSPEEEWVTPVIPSGTTHDRESRSSDGRCSLSGGNSHTDEMRCWRKESIGHTQSTCKLGLSRLPSQQTLRAVRAPRRGNGHQAFIRTRIKGSHMVVLEHRSSPFFM
ncbi:hypothetical protein EDD15DRAFT_2248228 [Pisolithus albus]|nr:hypothetical protein EDD15DRAFT_2248228 [Pisolithus albus]